MRSVTSKGPRFLLSTIAALGLAVLPLVPSLGTTPAVFAANPTVTHSNGSTVVTEGGSGGSNADTFFVTLDRQPSGNVTFELTSLEPNDMGVAPTIMTITPADWNVQKTVTVTATDDGSVEGTETGNIRMRITISEDPLNFPVGQETMVPVTINDNDASTADLVVSRSSFTVSESGTSQDFTVRLNRQPTGNVVVDIASDDVDEATITSGSRLTFTPENWNQPQTVRVTGMNDTSNDGSQTTDINLTTDDAATQDPSFHSVSERIEVTTTDDEASATFSVSNSSISVNESGTTGSFDVVLNKQPLSDVVVRVTMADNSEATVNRSDLRFTRDNWNVAQRVTVTGRDDSNDDGDRTTTITLAVVDAESDDEFDSASNQTVTVTTVDNDPAVIVRPAPLFPANGAKIAGLGTELRWTQSSDTRWFELRVTPFNNDGPGIHLIISDDDEVAGASYTVEDPDFGTADPDYVMLPDMTYTWQVRTAAGTSQPGSNDWSAWSDPSTFETGNKFSNTITLMGNGGTAGSNRPTLMWSNSDNDVYYYEVQVSRDSNFCMSAGCPMLYWELKHGGLTNPLNSYTIPSAFPLEGGQNYFWRVRPRIQGDGTPVAWSQAATFRTQ